MITVATLARFGMTLDWYLQKFYNYEEMVYLVRVAQQMKDSQPTLADLAIAGVTLDTYIGMKYVDFCRLYAEKKLAASPDGPQVKN